MTSATRFIRNTLAYLTSPAVVTVGRTVARPAVAFISTFATWYRSHVSPLEIAERPDSHALRCRHCGEMYEEGSSHPCEGVVLYGYCHGDRCRDVVILSRVGNCGLCGDGPVTYRSMSIDGVRRQMQQLHNRRPLVKAATTNEARLYQFKGGDRMK